MSRLRMSIRNPPPATRRRVWRGWFPANATIVDVANWALIGRYPIPTRAECRKFHGKDCRPQRAYVKIARNEITIRTGEAV